MPRCTGGYAQRRRRRINQREEARELDRSPFSDLLHVNRFYIDNVPHSMAVACDKCDKWRLVKEYQETNEVPEIFECSMWNLGEEERGDCYIPQIVDDTECINERYTPGSLVWAKMRGFPRWPAMVEDDPLELLYHKDVETDSKYHVVFFGDKVSRTWIREKYLEPFSESALDALPARSDLKRAIEDATTATKMRKEDRLMAFSFANRFGQKSIKLQGNDRKSSVKRLKRSGCAQQFSRARSVDHRRTNKCKLEGKLNSHPSGDDEEQMQEVHLAIDVSQNEEGRESCVSNVSENHDAFEPSLTENQEEAQNKEMDFIIDANNNNACLDDRNGSESKHSTIMTQSSQDENMTATILDSDNEDEVLMHNSQLYRKYLDTHYPSLFGIELCK